MLPYLSLACNSSSTHAMTVWYGRVAAWWRRGSPLLLRVAWSGRGVAKPARLQHALQSAGHMPPGLSAPRRPVTRTDTSTLCSPPPHGGPHVYTSACTPCQGTTRSTARASHGRSIQRCPRWLCSNRPRAAEHGTCRVFWGEVSRVLGRSIPCFGEKYPVFWGEVPRVLGRSTPCFGEKTSMISHASSKAFAYQTVKKTVKKTTHTTPCVSEMA